MTLEQVATLPDFQLVPTNWDEPDPEIEFLFEPYLYVGTRTWAFGRTESGKSIWAQWVSAQLTRQGKRVVYVQQENPSAVERRRWRRLGFDRDHLAHFYDQGIDLVEPLHIARLMRAAQSAQLVVIDSLGACWSGDENSSQAIRAFDRKVLMRLKDELGCASIVIHHTGHRSLGRDAATAGRGSTSQGQAADVTLQFKTDRRYPEGTFMIEHGKNRPGGGKKEPRARFQVIDLPHGGLDIVEDVAPLKGRTTERQEQAADAVRAVLEERGGAAGWGELLEATGLSVNMLTKGLELAGASRAARGRYELEGGKE
jgi:predicted ATP-dependent serine protease